MILLNRKEGIGTGWSIMIPQNDARHTHKKHHDFDGRLGFEGHVPLVQRLIWNN